MIHYTVHVHIDRDIEDAWYTYMRDTHIPDVLATGYFEGCTIRKRLEPEGGAGRAPYSFVYRCTSRERFREYQQQAAPGLQKDHNDRYQGRFNASREVFEVDVEL